MSARLNFWAWCVFVGAWAAVALYVPLAGLVAVAVFALGAVFVYGDPVPE